MKSPPAVAKAVSGVLRMGPLAWSLNALATVIGTPSGGYRLALGLLRDPVEWGRPAALGRLPLRSWCSDAQKCTPYHMGSPSGQD